jgi:indole-3-glycerol phosphate synthase
MSRFLSTMAERSRSRAADLAGAHPLEELREAAFAAPSARPIDRFGEVFDLIAELKPRSPAQGTFAERSPTGQALAYEAGGAALLSVLTEPSEFGGSIEMVRSVSAVASVPVMAKDFLTDPIQVYDARSAGADGILAIVRILDDKALTGLLDAASECGCFVLLEAFDGADLARISLVAAGRANLVVGVNCRDLDTLQVVPARHLEMADRLPQGMVAVAESAITGPADVELVSAAGYGAALVGSALMRAEEPEILVRELVEAGRRAARVAS